MRLRSTTDKNRRPKVPSPSAREPEFLRSLALGSMMPDIISYVTEFLSPADVIHLRQTSTVHQLSSTTVDVLRSSKLSLANLNREFGLRPGCLQQISMLPDTFIAGGAATNLYLGKDGTSERSDIDIYTTLERLLRVQQPLLEEGYTFDHDRDHEAKVDFDDYCRRRLLDPNCEQLAGTYENLFVTSCWKMKAIIQAPMSEVEYPLRDNDAASLIFVPVPLYKTIDIIVSDEHPLSVIANFDFPVSMVTVSYRSLQLLNQYTQSDILTRTLRLTENKKAEIIKRTNQAIARAGVREANIQQVHNELGFIQSAIVMRMEKYNRKGYDATAVQEWYDNYLHVSDHAVDVMSHTIIEWGLP
jgi:hypothetical protein